MTYFFWTIYQGFRRGPSRRGKSEDFDQKTKHGLKSSVLGFINRETAQNDTAKFSIWFWDEKYFLWFETIRRQQTLWPFCHGHLGIFCGDSPRQKSSIWSFFCSAMIYVCFKRKKPECNMGSRDSTGIWSWPILTILTEITIFGHRFLSNQAFI